MAGFRRGIAAPGLRELRARLPALATRRANVIGRGTGTGRVGRARRTSRCGTVG